MNQRDALMTLDELLLGWWCGKGVFRRGAYYFPPPESTNELREAILRSLPHDRRWEDS